MGVKSRNPLELYRESPEVTPSARTDAFVLGAARASPAPARLRRHVFLTGAVAAAVVAMFGLRIVTTPTQDYAGGKYGLDEGLTRDWLMNLDLHTPTGPGSQEGLP
jgi:hypothetical protein